MNISSSQIFLKKMSRLPVDEVVSVPFIALAVLTVNKQEFRKSSKLKCIRHFEISHPNYMYVSFWLAVVQSDILPIKTSSYFKG